MLFRISLITGVTLAIFYTLIRLFSSLFYKSINEETNAIFSYRYLFPMKIESIEDEKMKRVGRLINALLRLIYFAWAFIAVLMIVEFFRGLDIS